MSFYFNPTNEPITLGQLIERLKTLSHDGKNDWMPVQFNFDDEVYSITNAWIMQDPDFNFDEANCGPDEWIDIRYR